MNAAVELDYMTLHFTAALERAAWGDALTDITLDCVEILGTDVTAHLPARCLTICQALGQTRRISNGHDRPIPRFLRLRLAWLARPRNPLPMPPLWAWH